MHKTVSRASFRRGKTILFFCVVPNHKDGVYLNYVSQMISGTLFHYDATDLKIKERAVDLGFDNLCFGDEFSITDVSGTRVYTLKPDNRWYNTMETDGHILDAKLEAELNILETKIN